MAVRTTYASWITLSRILALVALILVIIAAVIPGAPDWLHLIATGLLAIGAIIG